MTWKILQGDCRAMLATLPDLSVQTCVTSPPYWGLRDYGVDGQIGLEKTPAEYVDNMVAVFREVRRVLRDDGTLWLNLGDSYCTNPNGSVGASTLDGSRNSHAEYRRTNALRSSGGALACGIKHKDLVGIPWTVALALRADGWYLRSDIIWAKPNPMPESVVDRPTKAHEYLFLMSKSERYHYDVDAIREPHTTAGAEENSGKWERNVETSKHAEDADGMMRTRPGSRPKDYFGHPLGRNRRTVWTVTTQPFADAHFATFPPKLIEPCILAGAATGGVVLDPFNGAGTTGLVATRLQRSYIGIELNPEYVAMARRRIEGDAPLFNLASGE